MGKLAHQKRGKPRPRILARRDARMQATDVETQETLRRWVNVGRRTTTPAQPANDTTTGVHLTGTTQLLPTTHGHR